MRYEAMKNFSFGRLGKTSFHGVRPGGAALFFAALAVFATAACDGKKEKYVAPPPPEVTVSRPLKQDVTEYAEFTGTTQAEKSVDIRARVEGFLESINFIPASMVKKGDLLFVIDPKPFKAKLDQALADLATAKAQLQLADATLVRKERAFKQRAVSEVEVIQARAEKAKAQAAIQAAKATVETAQINLSYTSIHAPIGGRISRNLVDVGNLVGSGQATLLTSIVKDDPIYVYFSIAENSLLQFIKKHREYETAPDKMKDPVVYIGLANEKGYPHKGLADYIDNRVDPQTGTIQVRAVFPNADHLLVPGLFARVRIPIDTLKDALLVPEQALGSDQGGRYLLVVNDKNMVEYRKVELGSKEGDMQVIKQGLKPGDMVIVKGLQRVRPGSKVKAVQAKQDKNSPEKSASGSK